MIKRTLIAMIGCLLCLTAAPLIYAQNDDSPLIILFGNDLYAWRLGDNALRSLTDSGEVSGYSISPDLTHVVYRLNSTDPRNTINDGCMNHQNLVDMRLIDLATGEDRLIAPQPLFASPCSANPRSFPAWSPDGSQLAWTEYGTLNIYDVASDRASIIVNDLPDQAPNPDAVPVTWGEIGLIVRSSYDPSEPDFSVYKDTYLIYSPDGELLATTPLPLQGRQTDQRSQMIVMYERQEYLFVQYYDTGESELVDLLTGEAFPSPTSPERYNALAGETSLSIVQEADGQAIVMDGRTIHLPLDEGYALGSMTISPDGLALAYIQTNLAYIIDGMHGSGSKITIWREGEIIATVPLDTSTQNPHGILWSPSALRVPSLETLQQRSPDPCVGLLNPRLTVNGQGRVLPSEPNNLRTDPTLTAEAIAQIAPGKEVQVINGPVCAEGIVWWEVQYQQHTGWTAESAADTYFLEPIP